MKLTNIHSLPSSFVDVIQNLTYEASTDFNRLSVTNLIGSPRKIILKARHWKDLTEDVSNSLWRVLGSAVHYVMAKTNTEGRLVEEKIEFGLDGTTLVARPDLYDTSDSAVSDYKITSIWAVKLETKQEWVSQINCYAWLLRKLGHKVTKAYVYAILRDWRKGESKKYDDYPPIPFLKIDIELWSMEKQEEFIKERIYAIQSVVNLPDDELPLCTPEERWQKETVYAVYKGTNKRAEKLYDTNRPESGNKPDFKSYFKLWAKNPYRGLIFMMAQAVVPAEARVHEIYLRTIAYRRAMHILLVLREYKDTNGRWPDSLDQIKDKVPAEAMIDPFTGGSFIYKAEGDKFLLYSVGENKIDEKGKPRPSCRDGSCRTEKSPSDDILIWPQKFEQAKEFFDANAPAVK